MTNPRRGVAVVSVNAPYTKLPAPKESNYAWQYEGACNNYNPETFYLPFNARADEKRQLIKEAKAICKTCPVIKECLDFALNTEERFGVWGGLSAEERQTLLRKRKRVAGH